MNTKSIHAQMSVTDTQIKMFEEKLVELLMESNKGGRRLIVDYDPCNTLYEACEFADINTSCLPYKSYTRIDDNNRVFTKYQYGATEIEI